MLGGDRASASSIGLVVAASTLMGAFVVAQTMIGEPGGIDKRPLALEQQARTAIDVLVRNGGQGTTDDWTKSPDDLRRFGLARAGEANFLDYVKIKALRNGTMSAAANNAPDYPDARAALGITQGDFHIRSYPVLPGLDDPRWTKDPRGRLAYVGHVSSATGPGSVTTTSVSGSTLLNITMEVRNDGAAPMVFVARADLGNMAANSVLVSEERHTTLLSPGASQSVHVHVPKMAYSPALTGVRVQLSDGYGNVVVSPAWHAITPPSGGSNVAWAPLLTAGEIYQESGSTVKFLADHYEGDGTRLSSAQTGRFVLRGPNGHEWVNTTVTLPKNKPYTHECTNCTAVGEYVATLWDTGVTRRATDRIYVSATRLFTESETLDPLALKEIELLRSLVAGFDGVVHDPATGVGDVFTDASHIRDLDDVIDRYTTLVVGSEVRQNALNAGETKWGIADWVQDGGNLVVFGTVDSQSNWLQPVYHAAQKNANGGISAPDPTHPVLSTPERLDYQRYLDNGRAWSIKEDEPFTHVLSRGQSGGNSDDTLAIANPGAYNDGTVVLTSYMPAALTNPQDDAEAKRLIHNLLSQSYNMLYLDYGPPVPDGSPVGSAQRLTAVPHPNVPGAVVEVRLVMYLFD